LKKKNNTAEIDMEQVTMNARTDPATLRRRLADRLRQVIGNPVIEAKELAAFDIVMNRRDVLKLGRNSLVVAGLVAAGVPPTSWARRDPSLGVHPCEVGLTAEEQASVSRAVGVSIGTELFQDTIYAQPLVSPVAVNSHALIEGAHSRPHLQSQLTATDPDEQNFLDSNYRWGPAELIQLEQDTNGDWELVHYHHPWGPRTDGVKTDGLVRLVIMTKDDGLVNPTKVITVTGSFTNRVNTDRTGTLGQVTGMSYMVFVEDTAIGNNKVGHLAIGTGLADIPPPYDRSPDNYPVNWISRTVGENILGQYQGYEFADKHNNNGYEYPVEFDPVRATEFIVLYFGDYIKILTLSDVAPEYLFVEVSSLPIPSQVTNARVVHINYDPRNYQNSSGDAKLENVVLASSQRQSDDSIEYTTYSMDRRQFSGDVAAFTIALNIDLHVANWPQAWQAYTGTVDAATSQNGEFALDYTAIRDVHTLYKLTRTVPLSGSATLTENFYVKLANFEGRGIVAFIVEEGLDCYSDGTPCYFVMAAFPLGIPSSAVLGEILAFSGGTSKFDGLRYVASDENGNLFLFRQRRYTGIDSPYAPPIYGNRDETGQPIASLDPFGAGYLPLPPDTSSTSNLHQLQQWISASPDTHGDNAYLNYNILLYVALAFATDDTSECQAVWLGNGYKAAYAPSRFAHDSEHVVIKQVQNGEDQIYSAFSVFKNLIDKTWRERQIASQMLITGPEQGESGDHYQATVTPVNAYGQPVSMLSEENANLVIEVRADSPCTVTDDTNNYYYDIDRYTSFLASPDLGSGQLSLLTKAETFSQVLYVRLVDASALSPVSDSALLGAMADTLTYAWQSANLAAQAQQRMGNDGTDTVALLGDTAPLADTSQYISGDKLTTASQEGDWKFKGNFDPTKNPDNLANLATYLNASGVSLISASPNLSLAGSPDGVTIDPLTALTVASPGVSGGARFTYKAGAVTPPTALAAIHGGKLGSIWSSISHALHDALHWLQNVEETTYQELAEGAVELVVDVDSITAVVSADIMKAVNGVEQELNEVVSTVEEYASVVANVIVTVVKLSYLYKMIRDIIALISLFVHLGDIQSLAGKLKIYVSGVVTGPSLIPDGYSSWNEFQSYFGVDNDLADQMNSLDVSSIATEVTTDVLNAISKNPFTKVIMKIVSSLATAVEDVLPTPPISFVPNEQVFDQISDDIIALESALVTAFENLTEDIIEDVITQISADLASPQDTLKNLTAGLETLVAQIEDDVIEPVLDWVDETARTSQSQMGELIDQDQLITVNLTAIKDLMHLFGIGNNVSNTYSVSSADAIFYPMAIVMWISIYTRTGRSVSSIDGLDSNSPLTTGSDLLAGSMGKTDFNLANMAVNFVGAELTAGIWALKAINDSSGGTSPALKPLKEAGAYFNFIRRLCNLADFRYQNADADGGIAGSINYVELVFRVGMTGLAGYNLATTLMEDEASPADNGTWTPSKIVKAATTFGTIGTIVYNAANTALNNPSLDDILAVSGQSLARSQGIARFVWDLIPTTAQATREESFPYFLIYIAGAPYGFVLQAGAVAGGAFGAPDRRPGKGRGLGLGLDGGLGSCPRNNGKA